MAPWSRQQACSLRVLRTLRRRRPLDHPLDRCRIERPALTLLAALMGAALALVAVLLRHHVAGGLERLADLAQAPSQARLWIGTVEALGEQNGLREALMQGPVALAMPSLYADAIASATQLGNQPGLFVFRKRAGDLTHH